MKRIKYMVSILVGVAVVAVAVSPAFSASSDSAALKYVGTKAGKAKGAPITIGWLNQQGAVPSLTEGTIAAQAAVKYINNYLGGVRGRPLKLQTCYIASKEEEAQLCAQKFRNSKVPMIAYNAAIVGSGAFFGTINGSIPTVGGVGVTPSDATAKNTYFLGSSASLIASGYIGVATRKKAKSVAILYNQNDAAAQTGTAVHKQLLEAKGIKATSVGVPHGAADFVAPILASGADKADVIFLNLEAPDCVTFAATMKKLKNTRPVVANGGCADPSMKKAIGDFPKWNYIWSFKSPRLPNDPQVATYVKAMKLYGKAAGANPREVWRTATWAFGTMMTIDRVLNQLGPKNITPAAIRAKFTGFRGPVWMGPPRIKCGYSKKKFPTSCADQASVVEYLGNGKWRDDGFVTGPSAFLGGNIG